MSAATGQVGDTNKIVQVRWRETMQHTKCVFRRFAESCDWVIWQCIAFSRLTIFSRLATWSDIFTFSILRACNFWISDTWQAGLAFYWCIWNPDFPAESQCWPRCETSRKNGDKKNLSWGQLHMHLAVKVENLRWRNSISGRDLREGKLGSYPGPPQLRGLHKNSKKNYYLRKHKKYFLKLIIWNKNMMSHYSFNSL